MGDFVELSEYERRALAQVNERKTAELSRSPRRLMPDPVRRAGRRAYNRVQQHPAAKRALGTVGQSYLSAVGGLGRVTTRVGRATLSEERTVKGYQRRGVEIIALKDIRDLDLEIVEQTGRPKHMDLVYGAATAVEGMATGLVISGGGALVATGSVAGAGAAAAPGLATVTAAVAADAAFISGVASRAVGHIGQYYGFDPNEPAEQIFIMSVINLGSAATVGSKGAAYRELSQVAQKLARRATWKQLNEHVIANVAQQFARALGMRLTQQKLGQFVPVGGAILSAGLNYRLMDQIMEAAYWSYRERFLMEKLGDPTAMFVPDTPPPDGDEGIEEPGIDLLKMIESDGADGDDEGDTPSKPVPA